MVTTGALVVVAPVSTGVAPATTTLNQGSAARPIPVRSVTLPAQRTAPERPYPVRSVT